MSEIGKELLDSADEMVAFGKGEATGCVVHVPEAVDVKAICKARGLTQKAFAARFGVSEAAVKDWEQGRRRPERPARSLPRAIEREPEPVERALAGYFWRISDWIAV